jgi:hypothetical protein
MPADRGGRVLPTGDLERRFRDEVVECRRDPVAEDLPGPARFEVGEVWPDEAEPESEVPVGDLPGPGP